MHFTRPLTALLLAIAAIAPTQAAPEGTARRHGRLVFELSNGDYLALDKANNRPIRGIYVPRGQPGAAYWRDDGLRVINWRGEIAHAYLPPENGAATVTNAQGECLTVFATNDIHWAPCRGGDTAQVWTAGENTLIAPAPWQGYLAYDPILMGSTLHIVRGEPPMTLSAATLTGVD